MGAALLLDRQPVTIYCLAPQVQIPRILTTSKHLALIIWVSFNAVKSLWRQPSSSFTSDGCNSLLASRLSSLLCSQSRLLLLCPFTAGLTTSLGRLSSSLSSSFFLLALFVFLLLLFKLRTSKHLLATDLLVRNRPELLLGCDSLGGQRSHSRDVRREFGFSGAGAGALRSGTSSSSERRVGFGSDLLNANNHGHGPPARSRLGFDVFLIVAAEDSALSCLARLVLSRQQAGTSTSSRRRASLELSLCCCLFLFLLRLLFALSFHLGSVCFSWQSERRFCHRLG